MSYKSPGHTDDEREEHTHYHGVDRAEQHIGVREALQTLLQEIVPVKSETIDLLEAQNRILFEDVKSTIDLPQLARSTRDGFAVNYSGTEQSFEIVGDVRIGIIPKLSVKHGEAVRIATGSYVPKGANSIVMKEYASVEGKVLSVSRDIKVGENILPPGDDISKGQGLLKSGTTLRPHNIALLSMLGVNKVKVFRRPKVAFFSTGDELTDTKSKIRQKGKVVVYDANRPFIKSMLLELGAEPVDLGIARDDFRAIKSRIAKGLRYDALILSAGSSVGERDYVARAADSIKGVRTLVHGVAMRPSSPTGLAAYKGRPFILLPGFPTSAIVSFLVFARAAILKLAGSSDLEYPMIRARLVDGYDARLGITHYLRVQVRKEGKEYLASIVKPTEAYFSKWMQTANGLAVIDEKRGEVKPNDEVNVFLIGNIAS